MHDAGHDPRPTAPLFEQRSRASSFGEFAALYDMARPTYPPALVDLLVAEGTTPALDVGCGTGILTRLLAARGLSVLGVEPDGQMAAVARGHGLDVEVTSIERFEDRDRRFGLLTAAQSWHWVEPVAGAAAAARVLDSRGLLALIWNHSVMPDGLREALDERYEAIVPGLAGPTVGHEPKAFRRAGGPEAAIEATGAFEAFRHEVFAWERSYTTSQWTDQLRTHSDHALLDPPLRESVLDEVRRAIDERGGEFVMHYDCHASLATRR